MKLTARVLACVAIIAAAAACQIVTIRLGPAWPDSYSWFGTVGAPIAAVVFFASGDGRRPLVDGTGAFVLAFLLGALNAAWVARLMTWNGVAERWTLGPSAWLTVLAVPLALIAGIVTAFAAAMQRRAAKALP
ncbi:MAG: hypothetical protein KJ676_03460 [Alphaproteobacteria bacterium]|nr:hypothetical protein [Alphaproteobacteria bacterium]MBU1526506.1 hypothetical protein [Alphaproteobacteria bacterium]MBU2116811.1 hypothetical protein [Alphaproteobacteria bacterium]MBU2350276.1 hypothetical protein [Alphaproteobacteria bacterium]MBU2381256.1 hypothetical protein [Alphaproteobacteria bacterium]